MKGISLVELFTKMCDKDTYRSCLITVDGGLTFHEGKFIGTDMENGLRMTCEFTDGYKVQGFFPRICINDVLVRDMGDYVKPLFCRGDRVYDVLLDREMVVYDYDREHGRLITLEGGCEVSRCVRLEDGSYRFCYC